MSGRQKWALGFALVYAIFWIGGNYSFAYTHTCVRSHQEEQQVGNDGDTQMVTVCDWYSANAKRWTFLDPARAVATTWITGWADAAILGVVAASIGGCVLYTRRRVRLEREYHQQWRSHLAARE